MKKKKAFPFENSIQTRLSSVMLLVLVFALGINFFIFSQIQNAVSRIDAVFSSNVDINDLSDALEQLQGTVYEYLNTKGTKALENYYRYEQNYRSLIEKLNDKNLENEGKILEKNIRNMSESYLDQTSKTVQAKRGRNVERYKTSYEQETQLYEYINSYIYRLNNLSFPKKFSQLPDITFFHEYSLSDVHYRADYCVCTGVCDNGDSGAKYDKAAAGTFPIPPTK